MLLQISSKQSRKPKEVERVLHKDWLILQQITRIVSRTLNQWYLKIENRRGCTKNTWIRIASIYRRTCRTRIKEIRIWLKRKNIMTLDDKFIVSTLWWDWIESALLLREAMLKMRTGQNPCKFNWGRAVQHGADYSEIFD